MTKIPQVGDKIISVLNEELRELKINRINTTDIWAEEAWLSDGQGIVDAYICEAICAGEDDERHDGCFDADMLLWDQDEEAWVVIEDGMVSWDWTDGTWV